MKQPVVTFMKVGTATARIHGDKPLGRKGEAAMRELVRVVAKQMREGKFDAHPR